jgi:PD-(D/E)XK nuclease superfamily
VTLTAGAVTVPVGSGWKLCFQKQYREFWIEPDRRGLYSRIMAPDVVAVHEPANGEAGRLIVLDAKYRIDDALNDALSSIHTAACLDLGISHLHPRNAIPSYASTGEPANRKIVLGKDATAAGRLQRKTTAARVKLSTTRALIRRRGASGDAFPAR